MFYWVAKNIFFSNTPSFFRTPRHTHIFYGTHNFSSPFSVEIPLRQGQNDVLLRSLHQTAHLPEETAGRRVCILPDWRHECGKPPPQSGFRLAEPAAVGRGVQGGRLGGLPRLQGILRQQRERLEGVLRLRRARGFASCGAVAEQTHGFPQVSRFGKIERVIFIFSASYRLGKELVDVCEC